jgi:hypothetical protein
MDRSEDWLGVTASLFQRHATGGFNTEILMCCQCCAAAQQLACSRAEVATLCCSYLQLRVHLECIMINRLEMMLQLARALCLNRQTGTPKQAPEQPDHAMEACICQCDICNHHFVASRCLECTFVHKCSHCVHCLAITRKDSSRMACLQFAASQKRKVGRIIRKEPSRPVAYWYSIRLHRHMDLPQCWLLLSMLAAGTTGANSSCVMRQRGLTIISYRGYPTITTISWCDNRMSVECMSGNKRSSKHCTSCSAAAQIDPISAPFTGHDDHNQSPRMVCA